MRDYSCLQRLMFLFVSVSIAWAAVTKGAPGSQRFIQISTACSTLTLGVGDDDRLYQLSYGVIGTAIAASQTMPLREQEFYPPFGGGYVWEPALEALHVDGNTSTDLRFVKTESKIVAPDVTLTRIVLKDSFYPFYVTLCLKCYRREDVIEQWVEIHHDENGVVVLRHFASAALMVPEAGEYWLTQFYGDWGREATMAQEKLGPGIKILDSKLGVRAGRFRFPSFILSLGGPRREEAGTVIGGSLAWSGSYQLTFDIDSDHHLRALGGINPVGEEYHLKRGEIFKTPAMLWTWSDH